MSVVIASVVPASPADKAGVRAGWSLVSVSGHEIMDVLDYRFYQNESELTLALLDDASTLRKIKIKKDEYEELGLEFSTYLMDKQRSCANRCVFCFIDQLPRGMRKSLYFKDDDSRLSFLFGNYITLTNITEHEVERIIKMHISPVNVSVHTTNPELRVKMMGNKNAGRALDTLYRLLDAGIDVNCQLVLCPGINDGDELRRTLSDLLKYRSMGCVAAVPVGLTGHREGLFPIHAYDGGSAREVLDIIDEFGDRSKAECGARRVFAADEFYLMTGREVPPSEYYEDFAQLENGVGLIALMRDESFKALDEAKPPVKLRKVSVATGEAAFPLISNIVDTAAIKWHNFTGMVYSIKNNTFGGKITVSGLVCGRDLIDGLKGRDLGEELLIPAVMLRAERDIFLDDVTLPEVEQSLGVKVTPVENDGYELIAALGGVF